MATDKEVEFNNLQLLAERPVANIFMALERKLGQERPTGEARGMPLVFRKKSNIHTFLIIYLKASHKTGVTPHQSVKSHLSNETLKAASFLAEAARRMFVCVLESSKAQNPDISYPLVGLHMAEQSGELLPYLDVQTYTELDVELAKMHITRDNLLSKKTQLIEHDRNEWMRMWLLTEEKIKQIEDKLKEEEPARLKQNAFLADLPKVTLRFKVVNKAYLKRKFKIDL